jgi:hypothetical protein
MRPVAPRASRKKRAMPPEGDGDAEPVDAAGAFAEQPVAAERDVMGAVYCRKMAFAAVVRSLATMKRVTVAA